MRKILGVLVLFVIPAICFADVEDEIEKIADMYDSSNTYEIPRLDKVANVEYSKYSSDFSYNYGKYLSLKFIAHNSDEKIKASEIKAYSDKAIESLNKMLEINTYSAVNTIEDTLWDSSIYYINDYFWFPDWGYDGFRIEREYYNEYLYSHTFDISTQDALSIENVEGIYFWYRLSEFADGDEYYYELKDEDVAYRDKLKTVYLTADDLWDIKFLEVSWDTFELEISEIVDEYEWKNILVDYRLYIKYNDSYYSPTNYPWKIAFHLWAESKEETISDIIEDIWYYEREKRENSLKREWANMKWDLSTEEFLKLLYKANEENIKNIEENDKKIEELISKIDSDEVLDTSRDELEKYNKNKSEYDIIKSVLNDFTVFYESLIEPIDLTPRYEEINITDNDHGALGFSPIMEYPEYAVVKKVVENKLAKLEQELTDEEYKKRISDFSALLYEKRSELNIKHNETVSIQEKQKIQKYIRIIEILGFLIGSAWTFEIELDYIFEILWDLPQNP